MAIVSTVGSTGRQDTDKVRIQTIAPIYQQGEQYVIRTRKNSWSRL